MLVWLVVAAAVIAQPAHALDSEQSQLSQTVQPITCVYTTTATGDTTSSSTDCDSLAAATLDEVQPRDGRPLLGGTVTAVGLTGFRVWVGGVWFTNGSSPYLNVFGTNWTLDLASITLPLPAGDYTIVLEERVNNNFLLRSVYEEVLTIPVREVTRTDTNDGKRVTTTYSSDGKEFDGQLLSPFTRPPLIDVDLSGEDYVTTIYGQELYTSDVVVKRSSLLLDIAPFVGFAVLVGLLAYAGVRYGWFARLLKR